MDAGGYCGAAVVMGVCRGGRSVGGAIVPCGGGDRGGGGGGEGKGSGGGGGGR